MPVTYSIVPRARLKLRERHLRDFSITFLRTSSRAVDNLSTYRVNRSKVLTLLLMRSYFLRSASGAAAAIVSPFYIYIDRFHPPEIFSRCRSPCPSSQFTCRSLR